MQAMQNLINVPEVAATMRDMSREMMKVIFTSIRTTFCKIIKFETKICKNAKGW